MNLTEMRAGLRRDLKDGVVTYKWADEELDRHIAHALKDLSYEIPLEAYADVPTTAGSRQVDISAISDRVRVFAVEYPVPIPSGPDGGRTPFAVWQEAITLLGEAVPDGSDCRVYYGKLHTMDDEGSTLPAYLEDLLLLGAQGYALNAYASYAVDRSQPDYGEAQAGALEQSRQLLGDFRSQMRRMGRRGKLRQASLYTSPSA